MLNTIEWNRILKPNKSISKYTFVTLCILWLAGLLLTWEMYGVGVIPSPSAIGKSFIELFSSQDFIHELIVSASLAIQAVIITFIVSMLLCYLSVIPLFKPLSELITKMRFLSLVGLQFIFMLITSGGHSLKVSMLVFSMSVFFVTSMLEELKIPRAEMNHARTLGMSEWRIVWEVKFLGRLDKAVEILRQNFAMAWMMLTMVEAVSRSEGGIGAMLINQNKHFNLELVFAIQAVIFLLGILGDYLFGVISKILFPYAFLTIDTK